MTAHVHYDVEDMIRRSRTEIDKASAQAMAGAPDEDSRRFVEFQRRMQQAYVEGHAEMLRLFNEGAPDEMIARTLALILCGRITTYEKMFGPEFLALFGWQMQRVRSRDVCVSTEVEINPVPGGRA